MDLPRTCLVPSPAIDANGTITAPLGLRDKVGLELTNLVTGCFTRLRSQLGTITELVMGGCRNYRDSEPVGQIRDSTTRTSRPIEIARIVLQMKSSGFLSIRFWPWWSDSMVTAGSFGGTGQQKGGCLFLRDSHA